MATLFSFGKQRLFFIVQVISYQIRGRGDAGTQQIFNTERLRSAPRIVYNKKMGSPLHT